MTTNLQPCTVLSGPAVLSYMFRQACTVEIPLQSYFRLNAPGAGQFEHTLIIVDEGARPSFHRRLFRTEI